jgi:pimeloyl-ACP methyl ester carboxylesterase
MSSFVTPAGITIEYDTIGSATDPALLFIMGFTAQMTAWDRSFLQQFVDAGYRVVLFDNRDCGLSAKFDGQFVDMSVIGAAMLSGDPTAIRTIAPYTLSDMANDAVAVLDHLQIQRAHIIGASMGGMIAQTMAIEHPGRTQSLTSIMSMTGEIDYGQSTPEAQVALLTPSPTDRAGYIEASKNWAVWTSKRYVDFDAMRARAAASYDRSFYPEGAQRQLAAVLASGSRAELLAELDVPTLVIHGLDDHLIAPSGGERTAALIPGANLLLVKDMGHDIPPPLWPLLVAAIVGHTKLSLPGRTA